MMTALVIHVLNTGNGWAFAPSLSGTQPKRSCFVGEHSTREECMEAAREWMLADGAASPQGTLPGYEVVEGKG